MSSETRKCQNCRKDFEIDPEDFDFYKKIDVPPPTFCAECRLQRRLTWRNDRTLYKRKCAKSGEDIISIYSEDKPHTIYSVSNWWSDEWDPLEYGREYDFSRPFFEQFDDLLKEVPLMATFVVDHSRMINSPYNNMVLDLKNCYMLSDSDFNEDCYYGVELERSKWCVDSNLVDKSELCYELVNCRKCYRTSFSEDCDDCHNVWFSKDLVGCSDCFGCVNLRKKKYHIFNEPYSKEDYKKKIAGFNLDSRKSLKEHKGRAEKFWMEKGKFKYIHGQQNDDVSGDYIYNSKNSKESWIVTEAWNIKHCQYLVAPGTRDTHDVTQFGQNMERTYEILQGGNGATDVKFSWFAVTENKNLDYLVMTLRSSDCFGCVSLKSKQYCILNKQYTKEEYEELVPKIKEHMEKMPYVDKRGRKYSYGEFFPSELSPFAYNETTAEEYYPLGKDAAVERGFKWKEKEENVYDITIKAGDIPDTLESVEDNIAKEVLECSESGKAFRITPGELQFHQQTKIPLPDLHPDLRHQKRMERRNPPKYWNRKTEDGVDVLTSYSPERPEKILSEDGYKKEII